MWERNLPQMPGYTTGLKFCIPGNDGWRNPRGRSVSGWVLPGAV